MKLIKHFLAVCMLCSVSLPSASHGDEDLQEFLRKAQEIDEELNENENSLLNLLIKSEVLLQKYESDSEALDIVSQFSSTYFSFANEHAKALKIADIGDSASEVNDQPIDLDNFQPKTALDAILTMANSQQIIMVNEAHHIAQHRALTFDLLEGLWERGYRYLALEDLSGSYGIPFAGPLKNNSGYYTEEPMFAYVIHHALNIGFKLIPYDSGGTDITTRELVAAQNIKSTIFDKDPDAKVLIHVGYSHIDEIDETGWLAKKLNDLLGIDPFTVDQVEFSENSKPKFENQDYERVLSRFSSEEPMALVSKTGDFYSSQPKKWDLTVISPRTSYVANKPSWMIKYRQIHALDSSVCDGNFPCMVEVFDDALVSEHGSSELVPFDKTVLFSESDKKVVLVGKGKYVMIVTDKVGNELFRKELTIL